MRLYAMTLTGAMSMLIAALYMVECTQMEFCGMVFTDMMIGFFAMFAFILVTEPRKKRTARWEKSGGLDVMIMGRKRR